MAQDHPLILVVDPEQDIRCFLRTFLECRKYDVVCVPDKTCALETLTECRPDLLIVDGLMPGAERTRLCEVTPQTPVLYISALPLKTLLYRDQFRESGEHSEGRTPVTVIEKPIQGDELLKQIRRLLHGSQKRETHT